MVRSSPPKVLISYSHDSAVHRDRVLALSNRLRESGVDCVIDQYEQTSSRELSFWLIDKLEWAEFVLVVCSETYLRRFKGQEEPGRGRGVIWEARILINELYDALSYKVKYIPIIFEVEDREQVPPPLKSYTCYQLPVQYELLYHHLTGQPEVLARPMGATESISPHQSLSSYTKVAEEQLPLPRKPSISASSESVVSLDHGTIPQEPPGSIMATDSKFYIQRAEERRLMNYMRHKGGTFIILGSEQMGKSSLLKRTIINARKNKKHDVFLDFLDLGDEILQNSDLFLRRFCEEITKKLKQQSRVEQWWQEHNSFGSKDRCTYYIQDYLLEQLKGTIFLAIDNVDRIVTSHVQDDFFSMLRSWHNLRTHPDPIWTRLDLALVSRHEPSQFIQDFNQSTFNVGYAIRLQDFQLDDIEKLNCRYEKPLSNLELKALMKRIGGHPYLVSQALYTVASGEMSSVKLFETVASEHGPFRLHFLHHSHRMKVQSNVVRGMLQVIKNRTYDNEYVVNFLERAGLVKRVGWEIRPRCEVYAEYFLKRFGNKK